MPEGPEVQTVVNALNHAVVGKILSGCVILDTAKLPEGIPADEFQRRIQGQQIVSAHRRGKYLNIELTSGDCIVIHLMMTGHLELIHPGGTNPRFTRLVLHFADGAALCFVDLRRFGVATLLRPDQMATYKGFQNLGVDIYADDFTLANFAPIFDSRRKIHTLLLDQSLVSGLGNIYVNETLFQAGIHPLRIANTLTEAEIERLYQAAREITQEALRQLGTSFSAYRSIDGGEGRYQNLLRVFQRENEPCLRCGAVIERVKIGGRSAFYCPQDQPLLSAI